MSQIKRILAAIEFLNDAAEEMKSAGPQEADGARAYFERRQANLLREVAGVQRQVEESNDPAELMAAAQALKEEAEAAYLLALNFESKALFLTATQPEHAERATTATWTAIRAGNHRYARTLAMRGMAHPGLNDLPESTVVELARALGATSF